jgi:hypothetical protein
VVPFEGPATLASHIYVVVLVVVVVVVLAVASGGTVLRSFNWPPFWMPFWLICEVPKGTKVKTLKHEKPMFSVGF